MSSRPWDDTAVPRRPAWGALTPLRHLVARAIAGPRVHTSAPAYACTILKLDHVGDFVLALGAIRQLVTAFGESRCALVVSSAAAAFAAREFPAVTRVTLPAAAERLFREIAPQAKTWRAAVAPLSCEHLVCLRHQRSLYRDLVLRAIPARRRWWLDQTPYGELPTLPLDAAAGTYPAASFIPRELAAHRRLVSAVLQRELAGADLIPALSPRPTSSATNAVVIAPLAQQSIRDLPPALLATALAHAPLPAETRLTWLGSAAQRGPLEQFVAAMPSDIKARSHVVAGQPLDDWIDTLAAARLVLAADSATAHLATALDRPMIALLGGGHPGFFAPWQRSPRQRWLRHPLPCYGCDWQCRYPEPYCLTQIPAEEVAAAARAVLAGGVGAT